MKQVGLRLVVGLGASAAVLAAAAFGIAAAPAAPAAPAGPPQQPQWAYAIPAPNAPVINPPQPAEFKYSLPGTDRTLTVAEIGGRAPGSGPADWYPGDHPAMPPVVAMGDAARGVTACALCHLPNGKGRPENSGLAGLPQGYIVQTLKDMKAGVRNSAEPRKGNAAMMVNIAKAMTDAEIEAAATYYASIKWSPWIRVVEGDTVPKTLPGGHGLHYPLTGADAGSEPIAGRIIETPENVERTEVLRDPRTGFIAYVPRGAVEEGEHMVDEATCSACHGEGLVGQGNVPALAGRSPSYIARQLNDFKQGARKGPMASQMTSPVARLTVDDITHIAAYIASLPVAP